MRNCLFFIGLTFSAYILSGCTRVITHGDVTLKIPAPQVVKEPYKPAINVVSIIGTSTNQGNTPSSSFGPVAAANKVNDRLEYGNAVTGNESESCGNNWQQTMASSFSLFQPQLAPEKAAPGFTIHAGSSARGGFKEERKWSTLWLKCGWGKDTKAAASSETTGIINFNFTPKLNEKDHLIIRGVSNNGPTLKLTALGAEHKQILLNRYDSDTVTAELIDAGPYMLTGKVTANSAARGKNNSSTTQIMTINMQSMKDSIALGSSIPGTNNGKWIIPIFISKEDILETLNKEVFKEDGKYYPCRGDKSKDCRNFQDVYVEWPKFEFFGGAVTLGMHLSGHVSWNFFYPGITGDLLFLAVPKVTPKEIILDNLKVETKTENLLVQYASTKFKENIQSALDKHKNISLEKKLDEAAKSTEKMFPAKYGNVCIGIKLADLSLSSWEIIPDPEGIMVTFAAELKPQKPPCKNAGLLSSLNTVNPAPKPALQKVLYEISEQNNMTIHKSKEIVPTSAEISTINTSSRSDAAKTDDLASAINEWIKEMHDAVVNEKK